ncbi:MAG: right-handed parallel beta-helix repeat-containing protein, partial [Gemmatimonadota bacterium]|nr:right-handed parallel beta-helix repeat-containing protein [Gemmatimonadota bacterium]
MRSGGFAPPAFNSDSATGAVQFAGASAAGDSGVVTIANVDFQSLNLSEDSLRITFAELTAAGTFADLLPTLTVTSAVVCAGRHWGDLDADAVIGSVDAQIVLMHSVGLAVADSTSGDVDGDGAVNPRDALLILSQVVGLDVSMYRVGGLFSLLCSPGTPTTLTVPDTLNLAPGDSLSVSAVVTDATGAVVESRRLAWASLDTLVVKVNPSGKLAAANVGAAWVTAAIAPGVSDSSWVIVQPRTRWRVDPLTAPDNSGQIGSAAYPFASIRQAIDKAAAGDTVSVAVALYREPLSTDKPLVFEGDSSALGMPVISTSDQAAGWFNAIGRTVVKRFVVRESQKGFEFQSDSVELASVVLTTLRGSGVGLDGVAWADLNGITVEQVQEFGIAVWNSGNVSIQHANVSSVGGGFYGASGIAVHANAVTIDSSIVHTIDGRGIGISQGNPVTINASSVSRTAEYGISIDSAVRRVNVTGGTRVSNAEGGIGGWWPDTLSITGAVLDSLETGIWIYKGMVVDVRDAIIQNVGTGMYIDSIPSVKVRNSSFVGVGGNAMVLASNEVVVDSVTVNGARWGMILQDQASVAVLRSSFENVHTGVGGYVNRIPSYVEVVDVAFRNSMRGVAIAADSLLMLRDTMIGLTSRGLSFYGSSNPSGAQWARVSEGVI